MTTYGDMMFNEHMPHTTTTKENEMTTTTELEERSEQFDFNCELHGFEHACRWLMNKVKRNRIDSEDAASILAAYMTACVENAR